MNNGYINVYINSVSKIKECVRNITEVREQEISEKGLVDLLEHPLWWIRIRAYSELVTIGEKITLSEDTYIRMIHFRRDYPDVAASAA